MQEKTKNVLLAVLIVGLVSMTVAYAALSTQLTISSSAKVAASKWDIKIKNFQQAAVQNNLNGGNSEVTVNNYSTDNTAISNLIVTFKKPGDVAKFTFDLVNEGDIDAKLTAVTIGEAASGSGITNEVKCESAVPTANATSMELAKETGKVSCEMTVTYGKDETLPETEKTVTISDTVFTYGQK